jgi:hypothetical protein
MAPRPDRARVRPPNISEVRQIWPRTWRIRVPDRGPSAARQVPRQRACARTAGNQRSASPRQNRKKGMPVMVKSTSSTVRHERDGDMHAGRPGVLKEKEKSHEYYR